MRISAIGLASVAAILLAAPAAGAGNDPETKKGANPEQIVCKVERFVGSRIANRVCKTRAEWKRVADDTKQAMDSRKYKDLGGPPVDSQFRPSVGEMQAGLPPVSVGGGPK